MQEYQFDNLENVFFHPHVGNMYANGIRDKKILVFGDSFYCHKEGCKHYKECTSVDDRKSSEFDYRCPERKEHRNSNGEFEPLHNEPSVAIDEYESYAYQNFKSFLRLFVGEDDNPWNYVAFTNYIQFFLPNHRTSGAYISDKDYKAFIEVVEILKPDIVVTWGNAVADSIRNEYGIKKIEEEQKNNQYYIAHLKTDKDKHKFTMVYLYHPSSRIWASDIYNSYKYFKKALEEK